MYVSIQMKLNATNKSTLKSIAIVFAILCVLSSSLRTRVHSPVEIETSNDRIALRIHRVQGRVSRMPTTPTVEAVFVVAKNWSRTSEL